MVTGFIVMPVMPVVEHVIERCGKRLVTSHQIYQPLHILHDTKLISPVGPFGKP